MTTVRTGVRRDICGIPCAGGQDGWRGERRSHTEGTEEHGGGGGERTLMVSTQARGFFNHGFERMARITRMGEGMFVLFSVFFRGLRVR